MNIIIKIAALILCCGIAAIDAMATIVKVDKQRSADKWHSWTGTFTLSDGRSMVINDLNIANNDFIFPAYFNGRLVLSLPINNQNLEKLVNGGEIVLDSDIFKSPLVMQLAHVNADVYRLSLSKRATQASNVDAVREGIEKMQID